MPKLTIDGQLVEVPPGTTLLAAARQLGLDVPTLCYLEGGPHRPSCMACLMKLPGQDRYVASCATVAEDGMLVESESPAVRAARKMAFELLLSDHVGDCVAVCERRCPAAVPIPAMIERIQAGQLAAAAALLKQAHPFPAVLGRVCSAPCEQACRRNKLDETVAIRELERQAGDAVLAQPSVTVCAPATGNRVAVIGGGPTGLTAAWFLRQRGHAVTLFEAQPHLGGHWRGRASEDVLNGEIDNILRLGIDVEYRQHLTELPAGFDASVIATGSPQVFPERPGVFRAVQATPISVLSVAGGRRVAVYVDQFLRGQPVVGEPEKFTSTIASFTDEEFSRFTATAREATAAAERCFQCACAAAETCRLRHYADLYDAEQKHFKGEHRRFEEQRAADGVTFQRGKCISCGLCVWTAHEAREPVGLTFVKRGFQQQVTGALGASIEEAVQKSGQDCVKVCPTGALTTNPQGGPKQ